jgi:pyruvate/2-oxoglutarate dehydrogenase complex dihydrolipoamide dehydrogenase (E3) component
MSGVPTRIEGIAIPDSALAIHARVRVSDGYLTLLSDGERLTGAHALGPEAGEWLQQATLAIRARVPLDILRDTIQPFPTFSEIYLAALEALHGEIATARRVTGVTP